MAEDPELGYCQGMNLVAALFAVAAQSQSEAYMRFRAFLGRLRGLWQPGGARFRATQLEICQVSLFYARA